MRGIKKSAFKCRYNSHAKTINHTNTLEDTGIAINNDQIIIACAEISSPNSGVHTDKNVCIESDIGYKVPYRPSINNRSSQSTVLKEYILDESVTNSDSDRCAQHTYRTVCDTHAHKNAYIDGDAGYKVPLRLAINSSSQSTVLKEHILDESAANTNSDSCAKHTYWPVCDRQNSKLNSQDSDNIDLKVNKDNSHRLQNILFQESVIIDCLNKSELLHQEMKYRQDIISSILNTTKINNHIVLTLAPQVNMVVQESAEYELNHILVQESDDGKISLQESDDALFPYDNNESEDESEDMGYIDNNRHFLPRKRVQSLLNTTHLESEISITPINMVKISKAQHKCEKQRTKRMEESKIRSLLRTFKEEEATKLDLEAYHNQEIKRLYKVRLIFQLTELRKIKKQRVNRQLNKEEKKNKANIKAKGIALNESIKMDASFDNPTIQQAMEREDKLHFVNAIREHIKEMIKILKVAGHHKERPFDTPSINQARKRGDFAEWAEAIRIEMDQMLTDNVHGEEIIGPLPPEANLVGSMWVLKIKRNRSTGAIEQYKARLVALGNQQDESSYDQIKSNTVRTSSVKLLIAIQAITGALSMVLDVKGAYLKSQVDPEANENLYLRYPDGKIYKLNKYLYGLKQAGFKWQENVTGVLLKGGYKQSEADPMIFSKHDGAEFCIMSLHVDDFYVISSKQDMLTNLHDMLTKEYGTVSIKSDDVMSYLGMEVKIEDNGDIFLSQPAYIMALAELLVLEGKSSKTPMSVDAPYIHGDDTRIDQNYYLSLVGALNHLSQYSRPDILFAVSSVAQKCSSPTKHDLAAVVRIFNYLRATPELGIRYNRNAEIILVGCVDASHNQYDDARGHYGYSFSLGRGNGSFDAKSTKMKLNTLSSTESEYVAFCEATREAVWLRRLLSDIGFPQPECTTIYEDNTSTIQLLEGTYNHKASKHVAPKFHYARDIIANGEVCVEHLITTEMEADMLTKPLATQVHWKFTKKLLNGKENIYDRMIK